jgi:hypothetical protein
MSLLLLPVFRASIGLLLALSPSYADPPALHAQPEGTAVVFYAQAQGNDELWPDLLTSLDADLAGGLGKLPNGFALEQNPAFFRGNESPENLDFSKVIVVKLLGRCDVLPQSDYSSAKGPLGWVREVSGTIQPFIFVDCERIAQVLRTVSAGSTRYQRRHEMAQAIAHVVIHEWIHIETQSPVHSKRGVSKQFLSPQELTAGPQKATAAVAIR